MEQQIDAMVENAVCSRTVDRSDAATAAKQDYCSCALRYHVWLSIQMEELVFGSQFSPQLGKNVDQRRVCTFVSHKHGNPSAIPVPV